MVNFDQWLKCLQQPVIDDAGAAAALLIEHGLTVRDTSGTLNEGIEDWLIGQVLR